jgi:hypothetical protein
VFLIPVESDLEFSNIVSVLKLVEATTQRTVMAKGTLQPSQEDATPGH